MNDHCNTNHLHSRAKIAKLSDRRMVHVNTLMLQRKQDSKELAPIILNRVQTRSRAAPSFIIDKPNVESFKRPVRYFGGTQWNNLLESSRNEKSLISFKNKQRTALQRTMY